MPIEFIARAAKKAEFPGLHFPSGSIAQRNAARAVVPNAMVPITVSTWPSLTSGDRTCAHAGGGAGVAAQQTSRVKAFDSDGNSADLRDVAWGDVLLCGGASAPLPFDITRDDPPSLLTVQGLNRGTLLVPQGMTRPAF